MARRIIDIGVVGNDGTGDSIRESLERLMKTLEIYTRYSVKAIL